MCAPNLLQFVPNDYIANNYLKTNFYLKGYNCFRNRIKIYTHSSTKSVIFL
jgi:hypothetical protein